MENVGHPWSLAIGYWSIILISILIITILLELFCQKNRFYQVGITKTLVFRTCTFNTELTSWLMRLLNIHLPDIQPKQVLLLDLGVVEDSLPLPIVWLIANTLSLVWDSRKEKKKPTLHKVRSSL